MLKTVEMYTIICDNCGCDSNRGSDYAAWGCKFYAKDLAEEAGWIQHEGNDYCPDCFSYDNNDEVVIAPERKEAGL